MRNEVSATSTMNTSGISDVLNKSIVPLILLLTLLLSIFPRSDLASSVSPALQSGKWSLIFDDEFNGTSLNTKKWTTCYPDFKVGTDECDHDSGELELYQPDEVMVHNGVLTLRAEQKTVNAANGQTYQYTSGMISSGPTQDGGTPHFSFQYGYVEMRAKVPAGQGLWPAFWTLPVKGHWPPEIDIFEILGNAPNVINMHFHYPPNVDSGASWTAPFDFSAGWHTYAIDWEPDSITWYVDGIARRQFTDSANIPKQPMYLIANLAVGGDWPGDPNASTKFPAEYQIDYIKVWQKK